MTLTFFFIKDFTGDFEKKKKKKMYYCTYRYYYEIICNMKHIFFV